MCVCGWKTAQILSYRESTCSGQVSRSGRKLGRFPGSQSTDIDTERQGLAPQFSGFHNPVVQKGLKTGLKIFAVLWFLIKAVFRKERRIVNSDMKSSRCQLSGPCVSVCSEIKIRTRISQRNLD